MVELLRESVVEAKTRKHAGTGELTRLERLTDHILVEGLYCFSRAPDIERMQHALGAALARQPAFTAASVNNNDRFLLHRDAGMALFSIYRFNGCLPDFSELDVLVESHGPAPEYGNPRRDSARPLTRIRLGLFDDGYCALWFSSVLRRTEMDSCARFLRIWSDGYDGRQMPVESTGDEEFDCLFGAPLEYRAHKSVALTSPKGRKIIQNLFGRTLPANCEGADPANTDVFIKNIKRKYCTEKYAKSGLKLDQSKLLWIKLRQLFEKEEPYLDVDFDLKKLAERMTVSQQILSQVINSNAGVHFYDLVDSYRMAAARELLSDPRNRDRKLLDIAVSSGFACQSTFFSHFKRATGLTPDAYRRMRLTQASRPMLVDSISDR